MPIVPPVSPGSSSSGYVCIIISVSYYYHHNNIVYQASNNKKAPETERAWVCGACAVSACGGVSRGASVLRWSALPRRVSGARTRRVSGARAGVSGARASGAGDAVNGKYEKKTVTVDAPRYQVVLVDTNLGLADMYEALNQDSRIKK